MHKITKVIELETYPNEEFLNEQDAMLLKRAKEVLLNAYAPYSKFLVGCALLLQNGEIVIGSNQENAAYPSGLCAERVAVFYAGAAFPNQKIIAMAITAKSPSKQLNYPIPSCGACLQSLSEYEKRYQTPIRTILQGETGEVYVAANGTQTVLPFQFSAKEL